MGLNVKQEPVKHLNLHIKGKKGKIKSTHDAMVVLAQTKAKFVAEGRKIAHQLAKKNGTVTSRQMLDAMREVGLYASSDGATHWVSVIFQGKEWKWTGQYAQYETPRTAKFTQGAWHVVKVWALK